MVEREDTIIGVKNRSSGIYAVDLGQYSNDHALVVPEKHDNRLDVWRQELLMLTVALANGLATRLVRDKYATIGSIFPDFYPIIQTTRTNVAMKPHTHVKTRPVAVVHTSIAMMNDLKFVEDIISEIGYLHLSGLLVCENLSYERNQQQCLSAEAPRSTSSMTDQTFSQENRS